MQIEMIKLFTGKNEEELNKQFSAWQRKNPTARITARTYHAETMGGNELMQQHRTCIFYKKGAKKQ